MSGVGPAHADTFSDQVLAEHNQARAGYDASPLQWNSGMESATTQYAQRCEFTHSDAQSR
jgi:uncharacterized protein YkwD